MEEMKVIKEQTEDFGEITVVVINGECYFLFSEVDAVMQLGKLPKDWVINYASLLYVSVRGGKSWRIEDIPGVGEKQLLIEMRAVYEARKLAENSTEWKKDSGEISKAEAEERIKALHSFTWIVGEQHRKYTDCEKLAERDEPLGKAMSEIMGLTEEEVF